MMEADLESNFQPPSSELTSTLELYLGELLAAHEHLVEEDREKAMHIADAVHDLRGSITSLNLRIYMLERSVPEERDKYMTALKESVADLTRLTEDILAQARDAR